MRAITVTTSAGAAPELTWGEVPDPVLGPGEVLIEVAAAGVNRADLLQARGGYAPPPGASDILGLECSGTLLAAADRAAENALAAAGIAIGDPVCALLAGGGYAERVTVPAGQVLPVPVGVSVPDAAGLPEAVCTVWSNLAMVARLGAGEWLLVHGGSSGIGTMAIQVAKSIGARVMATAGTAEKCSVATDMGADVAIDYATVDFVSAVHDATDGQGADVIVDVVGASYLSRNIDALADGGRLVVIGLLGGAKAELNLAALMAKRASVTGTQLRSRAVTGPGSKAEVVSDVRERIWPEIAAGRIRPVIGATLPLPEAAEAHRLLLAGEVYGKVVLTRP